MIPRFSCALNGVSPEDIDPALLLTDVTELPPRRRVSSVPTVRHGLMLLRRVRESLTVRLRFLIPEYDPVRRRDLAQKLHAWASPGGLLTTSDRPGQQLRVICDTLPLLSAMSWSDELEIDLTACRVPFWEYAEENRVVTGGAAVLTLPGDAEEIPVACEVTNLGTAALTDLTLVCGDTRMVFSGLALAPGDKLALSADGDLLRAETTDGSVLLHRTADSSDLLLADGGVQTAVSVTASQPVQAVFHARGRLL